MSAYLPSFYSCGEGEMYKKLGDHSMKNPAVPMNPKLL